MADEQGNFEIERIGDVTVYRFRPSTVLFEDTLDPFATSAFHVADTTVPPRIVVDLRNVTFVSSAVLGKLITLHRKVQGAGGWLKVMNLSPDIAEVFRVTKLDRILDCSGRGDGGGDEPEGGAGVRARTRPPTPSGGRAGALPAPAEPE